MQEARSRGSEDAEPLARPCTQIKGIMTEYLTKNFNIRARFDLKIIDGTNLLFSNLLTPPGLQGLSRASTFGTQKTCRDLLSPARGQVQTTGSLRRERP